MGIRSQELKEVGRARKRREIYDEGEGRVIIALQMHINVLKGTVVARLSSCLIYGVGVYMCV